MLKSSLLVAAVALLATGCVVRERTVYQPAPPPVTYVAPAPAPAPVVVPPPSAQVVLAPGEVVVTAEPPAPYVEAYPTIRRPWFEWVPGAWVWHSRWVWERGHWVHPPHRGAVWVGGRYELRGGVRVYVAGSWR